MGRRNQIDRHFWLTGRFVSGLGECVKSSNASHGTTTNGTTTTSTLPAGCTQLDPVVNGVTGVYRGSTIKAVVDVATLAGCAAECQVEPLCVYFAVHDRGGCLLRKTRGGFEKSGAYDAGMGECAKAAATTTAPTTTTSTSTPTSTSTSTSTATTRGRRRVRTRRDDVACRCGSNDPAFAFDQREFK